MSVTLFLLLTSPGLSEIDYQKDAQLRQPISMREKMVSIRQFTKDLSAATHVDITVEPEIADRKVTVFFKDRPASEMMRQLESTLFLRWDSQGKGYRLTLPKDTAKQERDMLAAEEKFAREEASAYVNRLLKMSETPFTELNRKAEKAKADYDRIAKENDGTPAKMKAAQAAMEEWMRYSRVTEAQWYQGMALRKMGPGERKKLLNGQTVYASNKVVPGTTKLGPDDYPKDVKGQAPSLKEWLYTFNFGPRTYAINFEIRSMYPNSAGGSTGMGSGTRAEPLFTHADDMHKQGLWNRLDKWSTPQDPAVWQMPVSAASGEPNNAYPINALTVADQLEDLHNRSGVPIVSDAFRVPGSYVKSIPAATVGEWVRGLQRMTGGYFHFNPRHVRADKGWLTMRHNAFWRLDKSEVPEETLLSFEKKAARSGELNLDDYGRLAQELTPPQASRFTIMFGTTVRFNTRPLLQGIDALRLWNALTPAQREESETGVKVSDLTAAQLKAYRTTLLTGINLAQYPDEILEAGFLLGKPLSPDLRVIYDLTRHTTMATELKISIPGQRPAPESKKSKMLSLRFGTSKDNSMNVFMMFVPTGPAGQ